MVGSKNTVVLECRYTGKLKSLRKSATWHPWDLYATEQVRDAALEKLTTTIKSYEFRVPKV